MAVKSTYKPKFTDAEWEDKFEAYLRAKVNLMPKDEEDPLTIGKHIYKYCTYNESLTSPTRYGSCVIIGSTYDTLSNRTYRTVYDINSKEQFDIDDMYLRTWDE